MARTLAHAKNLLEAWAETERRLAHTCRDEDAAQAHRNRAANYETLADAIGRIILAVNSIIEAACVRDPELASALLESEEPQRKVLPALTSEELASLAACALAAADWVEVRQRLRIFRG